LKIIWKTRNNNYRIKILELLEEIFYLNKKAILEFVTNNSGIMEQSNQD